MTRYEMMEKIQATLSLGEVVKIRVTEARGWTYWVGYQITAVAIAQDGHGWGGYGNLRDEYAYRVLGRR